jgi:hypothetical protein
MPGQCGLDRRRSDFYGQRSALLVKVSVSSQRSMQSKGESKMPSATSEKLSAKWRPQRNG